jgi:hypothetical protein
LRGNDLRFEVTALTDFGKIYKKGSTVFVAPQSTIRQIKEKELTG